MNEVVFLTWNLKLINLENSVENSFFKISKLENKNIILPVKRVPDDTEVNNKPR